MEKVWRIVYSRLYSELAEKSGLINRPRRDVELQPHRWRILNRGCRPDQIRGFELDLRAYQVRRSGRTLKLERIPMEVLFLLVERRGQLVTREEIIEKLWGKDVFLDTDNAINTAIRKIRQVLKDDPEQPRFIQTVTGRGYRFIGQISEDCLSHPLKRQIRSNRFRVRVQKPQPLGSPNGIGKHWRLIVAALSPLCWRCQSAGYFYLPPHSEAHGQRHDCPRRLQ